MIRDRFGKKIKFYDDRPFDDGKLFIYRDSMGIVGVVRADTWETAFEITRDEFLTPIPEDETPEAYGLMDERDPFVRDSLIAAMRAGEIEWPNLVEGYEYQSNATGTGIVQYDLNGEALDLLTIELAAELGLTEVAVPSIDGEDEDEGPKEN